jgi:competence protein ComEC
VALAFAAGVALGHQVAPPDWLPWAGLGLAGLAGAGALRGRLVAAGTATLLVVGLAGWGRVALPDPWPDARGLYPGRLRLEGWVAAVPERDGPRTRLPLVVTGAGPGRPAAPASGTVMLHLYGPPPVVRAGDRIAVAVDLGTPPPLRNPPGEPWLRTPGPAPVAIGRSEALEPLAPRPPPWWLRARLWVGDRLRATLPEVSAALLEGLLVGERRRLPPALLADFRRAGVVHVLAISGFNVALVAGATLGALRLCRVPPRLAAALALAGLPAFAAVVGGQPSVLRATVMGGLVLAAPLLAREGRAWNGLAAAWLALVGLEPASLGSPGLQLSFAATAGLLHVAPAMARRLAPGPSPAAAGGSVRSARPGRLRRGLAQALAASLGAQVAVTPLLALHWNQVPLVGPAANLLVVPLAAVLTTLGLLALGLDPVAPAASSALLHFLWALLVALRWLVGALAALPAAAVDVPAPSGLALAAAAGAILLLPRALAPVAPGGPARAARLLAAGLAALAVAPTVAAGRPDGRLRILFLDVGQGDAALVRAPDGSALLVDTAGGGPGRADRGERVVLPALRRLGVRRLAAVALTHAAPDHAGGLDAVLRGLPVDELWLPAGLVVREPGRPARGPAVRHLARGDRRWLGPVAVTVLHPAPEDEGPQPGGRDPNQRSLVLRVEWGLAAALLTGDAEAPAEGAVLAAGVPLGAAVLKVGHHGARRAASAPFVAAVAPRVGVVSVGARNAFGHPAPGPLARLAGAGAVLYRTDLDGAVEVESDGGALRVRAWGRPGAASPPYPLRGAP